MAATMTIRPGPRSQRIEPGVSRHFDHCFPVADLGGCQEPESDLADTPLPSWPAPEGIECQTSVSTKCLNVEQAGKSSQSLLTEHTKIVGTNLRSCLESRKAAKNEPKTNSKCVGETCRTERIMPHRGRSLCLLSVVLIACLTVPAALQAAAQATTPCEVKDDAAYTAAIRKNTTEPFFSTELVDHLPWSSSYRHRTPISDISSVRRTCLTTWRKSTATCVCSPPQPPRASLLDGQQ